MALPRYDITVQDNVPRIVPGAFVAVLTQPVSSTTPPGAPLATIYSDNLGTVPLANPFQVDGNGRGAFYAAEGVYTILIYGGSLFAPVVYPDQALLIGTGNGVVLQTNGVNNSVQTLLNLLAGAGITLSETAGTVTISSSGAGITFKTNGVNNSTQILLNLLAGTGISLSESAGTVTIDNLNSITLRTNGVDNGSQSILNLKDGTHITITDDGVGGVTITSDYPAFQANGVPLSATDTINFQNGVGIQITNPSAGIVQIDSVATNAISTKTANYTLTTADATILGNGTFTLTLPVGVAVLLGQIFNIKNIGTGVVTISGATIDGGSSVTLNTQYQSITIQWDGTQYWVI